MFLDELNRMIRVNPGAGFQVFRYRDVNELGGYEKQRLIHNPNPSMRAIHRFIIQRMRQVDLAMPFATACRPGDSPIKNVRHHVRNRYFFLTDLHSAYPSINFAELNRAFWYVVPELMFSDAMAEFFGQYCRGVDGGLATGATASPDLFNLYAAIFIDEPLRPVCENNKLTYTRYLDDLTFSSRQPITKAVRRKIRQIIAQAGFQISDRKTFYYDLAKGTITINGIGLELGGRTFLPRHYLRKIRGLLLRAINRRDITMDQINGAMGVFWSCTNRDWLNATEVSIVRLYQQTRVLFKKGLLRQGHNVY